MGRHRSKSSKFKGRNNRGHNLCRLRLGRFHGPATSTNNYHQWSTIPDRKSISTESEWLYSNNHSGRRRSGYFFDFWSSSVCRHVPEWANGFHSRYRCIGISLGTSNNFCCHHSPSYCTKFSRTPYYRRGLKEERNQTLEKSRSR